VNGNNISLIRGDSGQFSITVTDMNGKEVALNDDDVLTFFETSNLSDGITAYIGSEVEIYGE